jgi:RsiW-degrading membrane proteinase PrsW (M82 family)
MELIALAIAPGIAICLYIFYTDFYNREPRQNLIISFFLGALAIFPAILFEGSLGPKVIDGSLSGVAIFSYCVVAFSEETSKFLGLRLYAYNRKAFDEPLDGIVYAVIVSMGFATAENIKYILIDPQSLHLAYNQVLNNGFMRMFTAVPAHATFAVIMGYFVGKAKLNPQKSVILMLTGLAGAILFHGTYDFLLFIKGYSFIGENLSEALLFAGAMLSFIIGLILSRKLILSDRRFSREMFKEKKKDV